MLRGRTQQSSFTCRFAILAALLAVHSLASAQPHPIAEGQFVPIGGIQQWVTIRGADRTRPVLLFLHGGPGDAQSALVSTYAPYERNFVLVQWDQRNSGRTLGASHSELQPTSLEQMISDGIELATYVRRHLHTKKVILMGHSWGSFLGVQMVQRRPDLFTAFVGIGQVVSWRDLVQTQYWYTLGRARAQPDLAAVKALETMGGPPLDNHDEYMAMRQVMSHYLAPSDTAWAPQAWSLIGSQLSADDFRAYQKGLQDQAGLVSVFTAMDTRAAGLRFTVPMFLVQGAEDYITDVSTAIAYFDQIQAPVKHTTRIQGAGHFVVATHAAEVAEAIRQDMLLLPSLRK